VRRRQQTQASLSRPLFYGTTATTALLCFRHECYLFSSHAHHLSLSLSLSLTNAGLSCRYKEEAEWRASPYHDDVSLLSVEVHFPTEAEKEASLAKAKRKGDRGGQEPINIGRPTLRTGLLETLSLRADFRTSYARQVLTGVREIPVPDFGLAKISPQDKGGLLGRHLLVHLNGIKDHKELQPLISALRGPCREGRLAQLAGLPVTVWPDGGVAQLRLSTVLSRRTEVLQKISSRPPCCLFTYHCRPSTAV